MTTAPTISAVIPCYNAAPFLRETVESVLKQTHPALEVIVVDDGSTDDSAAIAESYGPPVRVIRQQNQGQSAARNRGIDEARGQWVGLLDADDRWLPHKLERQLAALREAPDDVVCVYSDLIVFGSVRRRVLSYPMWPDKTEVRVRMLTNAFIQPGTAIVPKSLGQRVRLPEDVLYSPERIFFMRLCDEGTIIHIPEPLIEYRKHSRQLTSESCHGYRVIASLWKWAKEHPDAFDAAETQLLRKLFAELLVVRHDIAFWGNDWEIVKKARTLYPELASDSKVLPPLFERPSPNWTTRAAYHAWNFTLDMVPLRLRAVLLRMTRRSIDRVKRGRVTI